MNYTRISGMYFHRTMSPLNAIMKESFTSYVWDHQHNSVMTAHPLQTSPLIKSLPTSRERSNPDGKEQKERSLGWDELHRQGIALKIGQAKNQGQYKYKRLFPNI